MPSSTILVLYYSRTGTTARLGDEIAKRTGADVEKLVDTKDRAGFGGFMRSLFDAIRKNGTTLKPLTLDPAAYDLVVIGTPDWGQSMSAPVRTFLASYRGRLRNVAFFLTDGTSDHAKIFAEMAEAADRKPVAVLGIPHIDVVEGRFVERATVFSDALSASLSATAGERPAAGAEEPRLSP